MRFSRRALLASIAGAFAMGSSPATRRNRFAAGTRLDTDGDHRSCRSAEGGRKRSSTRLIAITTARSTEGIADEIVEGRFRVGRSRQGSDDFEGGIPCPGRTPFKEADRDSDGTLTAKELLQGLAARC